MGFAPEACKQPRSRGANAARKGLKINRFAEAPARGQEGIRDYSAEAPWDDGRRLVDQVGIGLVLDHRFIHHHLADVLPAKAGRTSCRAIPTRRSCAARARPVLRLSALRAIAARASAELQLDAIHVEQLLELLADGVPGLGQDLDQRGFVQLLERGDDR
jgi:hypothetical protein